MKKFMYWTILYLTTFQMAFGAVVIEFDRSPASDDDNWKHEISLEKLNKQIDDFKVKIKGKELEADCNTDVADAIEEGEEIKSDDIPEEEDDGLIHYKDDEFQKYLKELKKNACGAYIYTWAPDTAAEEVEECKPKRQEGLIDKLVKQTLEAEKEDDDDLELKNFRLDDPEIRKLHKEAEFLRQESRKYFSDGDIEVEERQNLMINYLGSVALPVRDLIVTKRAYLSEEHQKDPEYNGVYFYESLLPDFPTRLFPIEEEDARKSITLGVNPAAEPFHLVIEDRKWGRSRLRYNYRTVLQRDILSLVKAPTAKNYVRSLKWMTLQMMMGQVAMYQNMLGDKSPIQIPRSCQSHFNGKLPASFDFKVNEQLSKMLISQLVVKHGLAYNPNNYQTTEYYLENVNRSPLLDGYSALMPFEDYSNAKIGISGEKRIGLKPDIDDFSHFETILGIKGRELSEVFNKQTSTYLGLRDSKKYTYQGDKLLDKILAVPEEGNYYAVETREEELEEIDGVDQNLSVYLVELMQRNGIANYEDLLDTKRIKDKYEGNIVKVKMPSLYGASMWRQWALSNMGEYVAEESKKALSIKGGSGKVINSVCSSHLYQSSGLKKSKKMNTICDASTPKAKMQHLARYLKEFTVKGGILPSRRLEEKGFVDFYPWLAVMWEKFRDNTNGFDFAKQNELEFLGKQMEAQSPWARVRFSYIMALDELETFKSGSQPTYKRGFRNNSSCFNKQINTTISQLKEAGKVLRIDKPISINHGNRVLNSDEKEYAWKNIISTTNEENHNLFNEKKGNNEYYKSLEDISYATLLSKKSVTDLVENKLSGQLRRDAWKDIDTITDSDQAKYGKFFMSLYKNKGDPKKQMNMFEDFSTENGIDSVFKVKMNFLSLDNQYKTAIFSSLIKDAATSRKERVVSQLNEFCSMKIDDQESMKALFYATSKAQNELNKLAGGPAIPEKVFAKIKDDLDSMSSAEWTDMWLGLGAGLLGVAAILVGGACTGLTGGLCAPLGVAMMAAGASALAMQATLITREYERKKDADRYEGQVKNMEGLGFTELGSSDAVSRGWFWTIFETVSLIPLLGVVARSLKVGSKMAFVSTKMLLRNTGKVGFKNAWRLAGQAGKTVATEADVALARYVLGLGTEAEKLIAKEGGEELAQQLVKQGIPRKEALEAIANIKKIQFLHAQGKISVNQMSKQIGKILAPLKGGFKTAASGVLEYSSKVVVKESLEEINKATAKTVAEYFGHNADGLYKSMSAYGKKLDKATKIMKNIEEGTTWAGKIPFLGKGYNWFRKLRFEHLAKNASKIAKFEKELEILAKTGGDLEKYVFKNLDDLTDVFIKIPMRFWKELPNMIFVQGFFHVRGAPGRFVNLFADGLMLRKIFNARSRLKWEAMKGLANEFLGRRAALMGTEKIYESVAQFQEAIGRAIEDAPTKKAKQELIKSLKAYEEVITDKVAKQVAAKLMDKGKMAKFKNFIFRGRANAVKHVADFDKASLRQMLFAPISDDDALIGKYLWQSMSPEDIFDLREVGEIAHRVVVELSDYKNVGEFQRFVNALRVIVLNRDPGVVEVM